MTPSLSLSENGISENKDYTIDEGGYRIFSSESENKEVDGKVWQIFKITLKSPITSSVIEAINCHMAQIVNKAEQGANLGVIIDLSDLGPSQIASLHNVGFNSQAQKAMAFLKSRMGYISAYVNVVVHKDAANSENNMESQLNSVKDIVAHNLLQNLTLVSSVEEAYNVITK